MKEMFATNVFGLVHLTNRVVLMMKARGAGGHREHLIDLRYEWGRERDGLCGQQVVVRGITQYWQAELRPPGIRVIFVCPSEVQTDSGGRSGRNNPNKLYAGDIGETIVMAALNMPRRALRPELAVFANTP